MTDNSIQKSGEDAACSLGLEEQSSQHSMTWKRWLFVAVVVLISGVVTTYLSQGNADSMSYKTGEARQGNLSIKVTAAGALEPVNQVVVGSELSGTIVQVDVDFNDPVVRGQILARLNTDQIKIRVIQAQATLAMAQAKLQEEEANFTEAKNENERCKALSLRNLCPPQKSDVIKAAFLRATAKLTGARAQVEHAKATLSAGEMDIKKAMIRTPIDGIILNRSIEPGQTVAASFQTPDLFTIANNLRHMELHVDVDEADVGRVRESQQATFTVDTYPKHQFPAQIKQLRYAPQREGGVVTYKALLSVDNPDLLLRPGMTATADIVIKQVNAALLVPNAALRFTPPDPDKKPDARPGGSVLAASIPWHPRRREAKKTNRPNVDSQGMNRVWVLKDGQPVAISIVTGSTDGRMTEVLKGDIGPGTKLLIDILEPGK